MSDVIIANTPEASQAYQRFHGHINAAKDRYPVVIGPSGVVFYDPAEYNPYTASWLGK